MKADLTPTMKAALGWIAKPTEQNMPGNRRTVRALVRAGFVTTGDRCWIITEAGRQCLAQQ